MIRLSDFVLPKLKQIEFNDNEYAYDNTAVITFVSQGLEPECYIAGKRVEKFWFLCSGYFPIQKVISAYY